MQICEKLKARNENFYQEAPVVIACLGDSVTHGCFEVYMDRFGKVATAFRPSEGYAAQLKRRLDLFYPAAAVSVLNAGVSGDSAEGGLARLERDVLRHRPDLVTVNFALNDCQGGAERLPLYERSMEGIFEQVLASGAECLLVTPNRMCSYVAPGIRDQAIRDIAAGVAERQKAGDLDAYVDAARRIARRMGVPVADAHAVWNRLEASGVDTTALLSNDINHPTAEMHGLFVEKIIEQMLR